MRSTPGTPIGFERKNALDELRAALQVRDSPEDVSMTLPAGRPERPPPGRAGLLEEEDQEGGRLGQCNGGRSDRNGEVDRRDGAVLRGLRLGELHRPARVAVLVAEL